MVSQLALSRQTCILANFTDSLDWFCDINVLNEGVIPVDVRR